MITTNDELLAKIRDRYLPIQLSQYALDKANFTARRVSEICKAFELPTYEIAMYMVSSQEIASDDKPIIEDINLPSDQEIFPDLCVIKSIGSASSIRSIWNKGQAIVGWAHSHGDHENFFSTKDKNTMPKFIQDHPRMMEDSIDTVICDELPIVEYNGKKHIRLNDNLLIETDAADVKHRLIEHHRYVVQCQYALVFNAANDAPFGVLGLLEGNHETTMYGVPVEVVDDGRLFTPDIAATDAKIISSGKNLREVYDKWQADREHLLPLACDAITNGLAVAEMYAVQCIDVVSLAQSAIEARNTYDAVKHPLPHLDDSAIDEDMDSLVEKISSFENQFRATKKSLQLCQNIPPESIDTIMSSCNYLLSYTQTQ